MEYFFIGYGPRSVLVWIARAGNRSGLFTLNSDKEPSDEQVSECADFLVRIGWHDDDTEREMEQGKGEAESRKTDEDLEETREL